MPTLRQVVRRKSLGARHRKIEAPKRARTVPVAPDTMTDEIEWWSLADVLGTVRVGTSMPVLHVIPTELVF